MKRLILSSLLSNLFSQHGLGNPRLKAVPFVMLSWANREVGVFESIELQINGDDRVMLVSSQHIAAEVFGGKNDCVGDVVGQIADGTVGIEAL